MSGILSILLCLSAAAGAGSSLIRPETLEYIGAFRLPDDPGFEYSGSGLTYRPDGDPAGIDDGFPGSLFILGHDQTQLVAEISIPAPAMGGEGASSLPAAALLQGFSDITGGMFGSREIPRGDLQYFPEAGGCLWFCGGQHMQFEDAPSLGLSEPDLAHPAPMGPWFAGDLSPYVVNDYLFEIPQEWAEEHHLATRLACGRFRDGTWGGMGPSIVALSQSEMDLPPPGGRLDARPMVLYGRPVEGCTEMETSPEMAMNGFGEADEWSGGAWLTSPSGSAVVLVGTKALGRCWYGYPNGVEYPTSGAPSDGIPEMPPWPWNDRGWWSEDIGAWILFFDPADLAAVLDGSMETWEPQPFASLDIDTLLLDPEMDLERSRRHLLGGCAFDRVDGVLYIVERRADGDRSVIHAFRIGRTGGPEGEG